MRRSLRSVGALFLGLLFVPPSSAQTPARLQSCYDGDTCTFRGLRDTAVRVRLAGIDTPEMDGNCQPAARRAKRVLQRRLRSASRVRAEPVEIGRYGRIIGRVYADTLDVSRWLQRRGLAVEYGKPTCVSPAKRKRDLSPRNLPYDPNGPDRDCGDFDSQPVAQRFFRAAGGPEEDPHRLDGDDDGIACEDLRGCSLHPQSGKIQVQIAGAYLGLYADPEEAARAYDEAAVERYGPEKARRYANFPEELGKVTKVRLPGKGLD